LLEESESEVYARPITYCLLLCGTLGYLSLAAYYSPAAARARLETTLGRWAGRSVRVDGCRQEWFGALQADRLSIAAAPVLIERTFLEAQGLEVGVGEPDPFAESESGAPRPPATFGGGDESTQEGFDGRVRLRNLKLFFEQRLSDPVLGGDSQWNCAELWKAGSIRSVLEELRYGVFVDRMSIVFRQLGAAGAQREWTLDAAPAWLHQVAGGGALLRAELGTNELFAGGALELEWHPPTRMRFRGGLDDLVAIEPWLPLLPDAYKPFWGRFRVDGACAVDIDEGVVVGGQLESLRAVLRCYDCRLSERSGAFAIQHVRGEFVGTESALRMGESQTSGGLTGTLWGLSVRLRGGARSDDPEVGVEVVDGALDELDLDALAGQDAPVQILLRGLRLAGDLSGTLRFPLDPGAPERWVAALQLGGSAKGFSAEGVLPARDGQARFRAESSRRGGMGTLHLEDLTLSGWGEVSGDIGCTWENDTVRLGFTDLRVRASPANVLSENDRGAQGGGETAPEEAGPPGEGMAQDQTGVVTGSVEVGSGADPRDAVRVELKWLGLSLRAGLVEALGVGGGVTYEAETKSHRGVFRVGEARLAPGLLEASEGGLFFQRGSGVFRFDPEGLVLTGLVLLGVDETLRVRGRVSFSGDLDLVCVRAGKEAAFRDELLDTDTSHAWMLAAGESFRGYRVTGALAEPKARTVPGQDPAFVRSQTRD